MLLCPLLTSLVTWLLLVHSSQCDTKCNPSELEKNIVKLVGYVSDTRYSYPRTNGEFSKFCTGNKEGGTFLKEYSNQCLRGVSKTVISVFSFSNGRTIKRFCSKNNDKAKKEMISFANCVNPNKAQVSSCYRTFINKLNQTHSIEDSKSRIPYMCCLSTRLKNCVLKELEKSNQSACSEQVIQSYGQFFDSIAGNVMNSVCDGSEESSDRCDRLLKLPKTKLAKVNMKTPFPIVISIFESL